jgi:hypothetical protein
MHHLDGSGVIDAKVSRRVRQYEGLKATGGECAGGFDGGMTHQFGLV